MEVNHWLPWQEEFSMKVIPLVAMTRRIQHGSFTIGYHGKKNSAWKVYHWLPWQEEFSMEVLPLVDGKKNSAWNGNL